MKKTVFISFFFFACSFSLSCGYSAKALLPPNLRTIYVEPFKNNINYTTEQTRNIYFPLLEVNVRNAIINRFLFDGNLRIKDPDTASLILKGELTSYERNALRIADNEDVEEYRVRVVVKMVLWDTAKQTVFWEEPSFAGESTYFVSGPQAKTETDAVEAAITDLARRVVNRTIEDW